MPETSPFPTGAFGALPMGGLIEALGGVSMADYFNNDNYEMRPTEASPKRGENVLRPFRMSPGDKTITEIDKDGNEVVTEKRISPPNTSAQTYPLGEGAMGDRTAIFRNEQGGRMPTNTVYPRPTTRSRYNRPNEYDRMARGNHGMGGPLSSIAPNNPYAGTPYIPIDPMSGRPFNNVDLMGGQGQIPNNVDLLGGQGYMSNNVDLMGGQGSVANNDLSRMIPPSLLDTAQSEMNRLPMLINQVEDGVFPPTGPNVYGLDEGMFNEDPDDERRRLLGELLRQYYQKNPRTYTSSI